MMGWIYPGGGFQYYFLQRSFPDGFYMSLESAVCILLYLYNAAMLFPYRQLIISNCGFGSS